MTQEQLCELPIPKWLGRPLYPGGFPLPMGSIHFGDRTVEDIWREYLDDVVDKKQKPDPGNVNSLKYYVIYYVHAPVFSNDFTQELRDKINDDMSLHDMIELCLEYGHDPF